MPLSADRVVIDTNILISAALQSKGRPRAALDRVRAGGGVLVFCDATFEEVRTRIMRSKFDRYVSAAKREAFVADLPAASDWVSITGAVMGCRDPDDDKFLEAAITGEANAIVSGDNDLLAMHPFRSIPILRPADFLDATADG